MKAHNILLVEDDLDLGSVLKQYLTLENYEVTHSCNGKEGLKHFKKGDFDLCILDVMMPEMDGFTLANSIKAIDPKIPFIFLTAKAMKADRIKGLKLGAADYIIKPFEADELVLRMKNILNLSIHQEASNALEICDYSLDFENLTLMHKKENQILTEKEAELLRFLIRHKNQLVKISTILEKVWGADDYFLGRSMNVFISRLRKYLRYAPQISIENIRGVGYILKDQ